MQLWHTATRLLTLLIASCASLHECLFGSTQITEDLELQRKPRGQNGVVYFLRAAGMQLKSTTTYRLTLAPQTGCS